MAMSTTLYSFTGGKDGAGRYLGVIRDSAGNLYGTTLRGGDQSVMCDGYVGCGTVFELTESGTQIVLYRFTGGNDGANPAAGLIRDPAGTLYGTAQFGGALPCSGFGAALSSGWPRVGKKPCCTPLLGERMAQIPKQVCCAREGAYSALHRLEELPIPERCSSFK